MVVISWRIDTKREVRSGVDMGKDILVKINPLLGWEIQFYVWKMLVVGVGTLWCRYGGGGGFKGGQRTFAH